MVSKKLIFTKNIYKWLYIICKPVSCLSGVATEKKCLTEVKIHRKYYFVSYKSKSDVQRSIVVSSLWGHTTEGSFLLASLTQASGRQKTSPSKGSSLHIETSGPLRSESSMTAPYHLFFTEKMLMKVVVWLSIYKNIFFNILLEKMPLSLQPVMRPK